MQEADCPAYCVSSFTTRALGCGGSEDHSHLSFPRYYLQRKPNDSGSGAWHQSRLCNPASELTLIHPWRASVWRQGLLSVLQRYGAKERYRFMVLYVDPVLCMPSYWDRRQSIDMYSHGLQPHPYFTAAHTCRWQPHSRRKPSKNVIWLRL